MESRPPAKTVTSTQWNILIIDDDEDDYLIARDMLKQARGRKINVSWASTYTAGLKELNSKPYHAVLVDYDLGLHSGIELIREVSGSGYPAPLILYTGRGSYEIDVEAMQAGATLYLTKGEVNSLLLERSIRYAIERNQIEASLRARETTLRHSNEALRESEERFRRAILNAPYPLMIRRDDGQVIMVNDTWTEITGYTLEDIPTIAEWTKKAYPDRASQYQTFIHNEGFSQKAKKGWGEFEVTTQSGEKRIWDFSTAPLGFDHEGRELVLTMAVDVTERKEAQASLQENAALLEKRNEALREAHDYAAWMARFPDENPNPVARVSAEGIVLYRNPAAGRLPGWMCEVGQPPDDPLLELVEQAISKGDEVLAEVRLADRFYTISVMPFLAERYVNVYGRDTTERKQAEESLARFARQLERSNRDLEQFAFVASHDLQEPLRKIILFGGRLSQELNGDHSEAARDYISRMQNAAERMQQMINGLLELARVSTRGDAFAPVDLNAILEDALSDLEARVQATGGQVIISDLPVIEADGLQVRRLFQNLIGNALKFYKPGIPPVIKISALVSKTKDPFTVAIHVEDNGIGFAQEHAERIFQPFQRLHGKGEYEGTGLGLSICQKIVERHHGSIDVQSVIGQGSRFTVTLPLQAA